VAQPAIRPGTVLELRDLPDGLETGPWVADRVDHRFSSQGATTRARLSQGGDSFDPTAFAGGLAGLL
jgi:hypothetical protein